jgi:hypothetical protein
MTENDMESNVKGRNRADLKEIENNCGDYTNSHVLSHPKKRAFLAAYALEGNISAAAKITGIDRRNHFRWMQSQEYVEAFKQAEMEAAEHLETEARRRAVKGIDKPIYYKGEKVDTIREYSDTLLIFLMKGAMPEKYSEKFQGTITENVNISLNLSVDERRNRLSALLQDVIDVSYEDVSNTPMIPETVSKSIPESIELEQDNEHDAL